MSFLKLARQVAPALTREVQPGMRMAAPAFSGDGIRVFHGSPYAYSAERLIATPQGEQYIIGGRDRLPPVPAGADLLKDYPLGRPRIEKAGSGEGSNVLGRGWYGGETEATARSYRDMTPPAASVKLGGKTYRMTPDPQTPEQEAANFMLGFAPTMKAAGMRGGIEDALRETWQSVPMNNWKHGEDEIRRVVGGWHNSTGNRLILKPQGHMYEALIKAEPERFVDWDKPLQAQTPMIQDALRKTIDPAYGKGFFERYAADPNIDFKEALGHLDEIPSGELEQGLVKEGVAGARHLDAGSRAASLAPQGPRTSNYAVYDPAIVDLLRRYIVPGAAVPAAGAATLGGALTQPDDQAPVY